MEKKKIYAGIDFGACNIKAAYLQGNRMRLVKLNKDQQAGNQTPNVIYYDKINDKVVKSIGLSAQRRLDYENKVSHIKTKLEQADWHQNIPNLGKTVTPLEVARDIFAEVWQEMVRIQGDASCWDITLTIPVFFSVVQKNYLYQAALEAGIPVKRIVSEPFAALFSQEDLVDETDEEELGLIFDFGGSTLDISLLQLMPEEDEVEIQEIAATGLLYGGLDIDQLIYEELLQKKYPDDIKTLLQDDESGAAKAELFQGIADAKQDLFDSDGGEEESSILISDKKSGSLHDMTITQEEVVQILEASTIGQRIRDALDVVMEEADMPLSWIRTFGGTSYIPYFRQLLADYAGDEVFDADEEVDEDMYTAVAEGAARYGAICGGDETSIIAQNHIPYAIGFLADKGFRPCINRNALPGFITGYRLWQRSYVESLAYKIPVYQQFLTAESEHQAPVYIGSIQLDASQYPGMSSIMYKMKIDAQEQIQVTTFLQKEGQTEAERDIIPIEQLIVPIGGQ